MKFKKGDVKVNWEGATTFSVESQREGGLGYFGMELLKDQGIPCKRGTTIFQGHVGITVPKRFVKRAERIIF